MIDNFEQISKLLSFNSDDEFYFIQILQRKKDNPGGLKGANNSSRLIKGYYIKSIDGLMKQKDEMVTLAEVFNARVGINLNKRSFYKTSFNTLLKLTQQLHNKDFTNGYRAWNSSCGVNDGGDKVWLLDFDYKPTGIDWRIDIRGYLHSQQPIGVDKLIDIIPSRQGVHVITKPFDPRQFVIDYPDVEIHKNNPVNLYIP